MPSTPSSPSSTTTVAPSSILTNTAAFRRLARWAFGVCDNDKTGRINQDEMYAGILLVHVNLAKYAGAAACYPPTRAVVDELFVGADKDHSGTIDEEEFLEIVKICSVDIASRIIVYYSILILLVPYIADAIVWILFQFGWDVKSFFPQDGLLFKLFFSYVSWKEMTDRVVSTVLFFAVIPMLFDAIDRRSKKEAHKDKNP